jgi:NADH:ubiquinone reductase (H+-translocating)
MGMGRRSRVVIIGAGFGGLAVARSLKGQPVDVVVVDANNFHTFQPLLYQVATAGLDGDDIAYAVRGIFRRQGNVDVRMARVTSIDFDGQVVHLDHGEPIDYDYLVIAAGAVTNTYGIEGVDDHAFPLKSLVDAQALRAHILDRFEQAASQPSLLEDGALTVVVCGGGPTGVELAGALVELFHKVLARDFQQLEVRRARVVLVEMADRLLPPFTPASSQRARRTLERRGVEVMLEVGVEKVEATAVHLTNGERIPAHTLVWAAGVRANPLDVPGIERARGGRIVVRPDLSVPGHPEVFAVGDIAASPDPDGSPLPQVAQVAIQGGRHVAAQIVRRLAGRPTGAFRYRDKGSMATIGRLDAITELPRGVRLWGPVGWLAWLGLHLLYLIGFRNRANVLVNWAWNYLTYDRGSRILAEDERERVAARR